MPRAMRGGTGMRGVRNKGWRQLVERRLEWEEREMKLSIYINYNKYIQLFYSVHDSSVATRVFAGYSSHVVDVFWSTGSCFFFAE
ncbi:hypothetical protein NDU88_002497 [Pleurodeles waltl]|uniref:Uncharacterized protein n=1 Tax=Pleurodeles waltl TaxID=8319 RepID=A0AAV7TM51_PLEWA|nr:hypothetical protein NDU88_002497 [Pleurodeles waltl]